MPGNHFGWSLSDAVENPRQTGLVNFRRYKLLEYQSKAGAGVSAGDDEDLATNQFHRLITEETTATRRLMGADLDSSALPSPFSRPSVKPYYYGRENSVSQCSDSCFGSDYPSLTSTGSPEPPEFPSEANMERGRRWMNLSEAGANQSTGWTERMDEVPRTSSGPPSTTSATTDVWRGSIHYAKAVMERREGEISSMYDQLHEIEDDLTSMNNQVGKVSSTLQHCNNQVTQQHRRRCNQQQQDRDPPHRPPMMSSLYQSQSVSSLNNIQQPNSSPFSSFASSGRNQQRRSAASNANAAASWSCRNLNSLTEDEMADIVHRLLTRICEFTLARQEGRNDIPLIV